MPFLLPTSASHLSPSRIKTDKLRIMPPQTFHLFSQLPCELRLQIWESAIRKWTTYFYDSSTWNWVGLGAANPKPEAQEKHTCGINYWNKPHPTNRSVFLWHAGLWVACKESREVMRKRLFKDPCSKGYPDDVDKQVNAGLRKWFYGIEEGVDVIWNGWAIFIFMKYAIEFDTDWTSELAGLDKYRPTDRLSPTLAFAIKVFCEIATQERSLLSVIHLIDRYSGWKSVSNAEEPSVYYDCKHQYIQIDPSNLLATNRLARSAPMLRFLDQVTRLLKHRLTWKLKTTPWAWGDYGLPPDGLSVPKLVRVLVRRDNEVVPKTTRGNAVPPKMKYPASVTSSNGKPVREKLAVR
ncbi:hypothetical protein DER44DRAFT_849014 [Fusarium oxysporum]|nr:hypothetical protein DER44DRAFT_849014 [Fusarium oxysporum]